MPARSAAMRHVVEKVARRRRERCLIVEAADYRNITAYCARPRPRVLYQVR